ncbi:MAG: TlpA family protein disulfide reductase [Clostridia bacterium]|nr:TlpA family protein disulfide reductase [Clostridia bacterium]
MKRTNDTRLLALLLALLLAAGSLAGCTASQQDAGLPAENAPEESAGIELNTEGEELAPTDEFVSPKSFSAKTMDGLTLDSAEVFGGFDVTAINIWATWCPPCVGEMPDLAAYEKTLGDRVQLITYCIDGETAAESAEALLKDAGYEGVTLVSADGDFEALLQQLQYVPTTIFVAEDGTLLTDLMIGSPQDFAAMYDEYFNAALRILGKPELE